MIDDTMDDEATNDDTLTGMMPAPNTTKPLAKVAAAVDDLSRKIERAVDREPLDWVRCVRVFGDFYRCNWWSRKGQKCTGSDFDFGGLITDHVRKSRFLRATMQTGQLVMNEVRDCANANHRKAEIPKSQEATCVSGPDILE